MNYKYLQNIVTISAFSVIILGLWGYLRWYIHNELIFLKLALIGALFIFVPILIGLTIIFIYTHRYLLKRTNIPLDQSRKHHAIIFASLGYFPDSVVKLSGIDIIASWCEKNNQFYCIHICETPLEFENVLKNPYAENIWVFGHGRSVHEFTLDEGRYDYDCLADFPEDLKKNFVAQLHCSPGCGHSLPYRICRDYTHSIVCNDYRWFYENRKQIQKLLKNDSIF